jgi:hypothetical protein
MFLLPLRSLNLVAVAAISSVLLFPQTAGHLATTQGATDPQTSLAKHSPHVTIGRIAPRAEDVSTVDGIIKAYYEVICGPAGQPRQWGRDATLYIPNVRFILVSEHAGGKVTAESMTHQEFVDDSEASLNGKAFYEREIHRVTQRAGNIVHVFSTSEHSSAPDGPVEGRSVDSLELFYDGTRWWIASVNIWEFGKNRPLPAEFLP